MAPERYTAFWFVPGLPAGPAGFHEFQRGPEQFEILLVIGCLGTVDLDPLPGTPDSAGLKRDDVVPRKLQFGRHAGGQAKSNAVAADAGEHSVADEIGVEAVDFSR